MTQTKLGNALVRFGGAGECDRAFERGGATRHRSSGRRRDPQRSPDSESWLGRQKVNELAVSPASYERQSTGPTSLSRIFAGGPQTPAAFCPMRVEVNGTMARRHVGRSRTPVTGRPEADRVISSIGLNEWLRIKVAGDARGDPHGTQNDPR